MSALICAQECEHKDLGNDERTRKDVSACAHLRSRQQKIYLNYYLSAVQFSILCQFYKQYLFLISKLKIYLFMSYCKFACFSNY